MRPQKANARNALSYGGVRELLWETTFRLGVSSNGWREPPVRVGECAGSVCDEGCNEDVWIGFGWKRRFEKGAVL